MAIDYNPLMERRFAPVEHRYNRRDTILYALGIGLGFDPVDPRQLTFVYEANLMVMPSMAAILGYPGFWAKEPDAGIDWRRVVHVSQSIVLHRPLAPEGRITAHNRISALYDRGRANGAVLCQERTVADAASGEQLAAVQQVNLLRGDGGFGGPPAPHGHPHQIPAREPDAVCNLPTLPQAALIYRLSGDTNPLHADPAIALAAGYSRPILHGLCTMGVACHAAIRSFLEYEPARIRSMYVRFSAPVIPGDTIRNELWLDGDVISFRSFALERGVMVLNAGRIDLAAA